MKEKNSKSITLLGAGTVVTGGSAPLVIENGAVAFSKDRVLEVGPEKDLRSIYPDARFLDAQGGIILPGFINLHHHFYSALAVGLDSGMPIIDFTQILDRFWWRLDRAHDWKTIELSAFITAADCIQNGCTTVFDHHASPSCIKGSLNRIAQAVTEAGISSVLCYEVSDRNGHKDALLGIEENISFIEEHLGDPQIRGAFGMHACFTLRDETLSRIASRAPKDCGIHIHVAEDKVDVAETQDRFGVGPVQLLDDLGLINEHALLAHGVHLSERELGIIGERGAVLIHNPESNANNRVGRLDIEKAVEKGCLIGLGTDGMTSAMLLELRFAILNQQGVLADAEALAKVISKMLFANNAMVARRFFDEPLLGELVKGAPADIAVIDAPLHTKIDSSNIFSHMIYRAAGAPVRHTIGRGNILMKDFQIQTLDRKELAAKAREISPDFQERFHKKKAGTPFRG